MPQVSVISGTFLLIGIMFLNGGIALIKDTRARKRRCTARTKAKVLKFTYWGTEETPYTLYVPRYEYRDEKGEKYVIEGVEARHRHPMKHGDEVDILYDPNAPENHFYVPCERPMETPLLFFGCGVLTTAVSIAFFIWSLYPMSL